MSHRFNRHYTREEARELLPSVRQWLAGLQQAKRKLRSLDERIEQVLAGGQDAGGVNVEEQVRIIASLKELLQEFASRQIQIKDVDRGLLDFPAIIEGREVFLCWEQDEEDIEFWHELDTGYAGREKL